MSEFIPLNDLDRAILAAGRSRSAAPELYRQLGEGELWFLVPYHPEVEGGELEIANGKPMPFVQFEEAEGSAVALFSSEARIEEGLKNGRVPPRTFSAGSLPAKLALEVLGKMDLHAVINKGCATGQLVIPPNLMRDLADGSALRPMDTDVGEAPRQGRLALLDAADYPTDLVQPMFEILRQHRNFRAAWVFGMPGTTPLPDGGKRYQLLILMHPRDAVVFHDLNMVVQAARRQIDDVELGLLDETDAPYVAGIFRQAAPFFVAVDYPRPDGAKE